MDLYEAVAANEAKTVLDLVTSIEKLEALSLYSEDVQELLNSYVIQLQKELNAYVNTYENKSLEE